MSNLKGQGNYATKHHHEREHSRNKVDQDLNRNTKRAIGTIHQIDPDQKGKLIITAWIGRSGQGRRLWGDGKEITIIDSPLDLLMRFGGLVPGMVIEISWRGISETGKAYARVLAEATTHESVKSGEQIPQREVDTQSSLPFEPLGI